MQWEVWRCGPRGRKLPVLPSGREVEKGLNHAAEALQKQAGLDENGEADGALLAAANAIQNATQTANQGESDQIRAQVAEMLQWMATTEAQGEEFGQGVTERARELT